MPQDEESVNGSIVKAWLLDWAKPAAAALCIGCGLYYRMQWDLAEIKEHGMVYHARLIEETRAELARKSAFGPDGFLDSGIAAGLNSHIDKRVTQSRREWARKLHQLNPAIVIPEE